MQLHHVVFRVTCTAEDPQAPARVMGVFVSRGLLLDRYACSLGAAGLFDIEVTLDLEEEEGTGPCHLARLISRFPVVLSVDLLVDGSHTPFEVGNA